MAYGKRQILAQRRIEFGQHSHASGSSFNLFNPPAMQRLLPLVCALACAATTLAADLSFVGPKLESIIRQEMREWGIGGIAVALVDDQSVVYAAGWLRRGAASKGMGTTEFCPQVFFSKEKFLIPTFLCLRLESAPAFASFHI
jgi:hypothetical protein